MYKLNTRYVLSFLLCATFASSVEEFVPNGAAKLLGDRLINNAFLLKDNIASDTQFVQSNQLIVQGPVGTEAVQMVPGDVAPVHQVISSNQNSQPLDLHIQEHVEKLPLGSQFVAKNNPNLPNMALQINPNFPNNGPIISHNVPNIPRDGLVAPQNNQNFLNNGPIISHNAPNIPRDGLAAPQNNPNFPNNGPIISHNGPNIQRDGLVASQNNQNFPNNAPVVLQHNLNSPHEFANQPNGGDDSIQEPSIQNVPHAGKSLRNGIGFIAQSEECAADVQHVCSGINPLNNFDVLYCLTQNGDYYQVSEDCHQYVWNFKLNATTDARFQLIAKEICRQSIDIIADCQNHDDSDGKLISCLLDNKESITTPTCNSFITRVQTIMFSDYRLICDFVTHCKRDIETHKCGKMGTAQQFDRQQVHSQGDVINCLAMEYGSSNQLSPECRKQITRLAELSADDYHLDRHLYFKCKSDRESLCSNIVSGQGRVYKCLFDHKFDQQMSAECSEALTGRQKLVAEDYKASYGLAHHCKVDIEKNDCFPKGKLDEDHISLATVMLCLENQNLNGVPISNACDDELVEYRRMIMEDYELSPEIVHECSAEIRDKCQNGLEKEGKTLHCLLALAQEKDGINSDCQNALMDLIKETKVAQDYRVDGVLKRACHSVIHAKCGDLQDGDPMVLSCLMDNMHSKDMNKKCLDRLLELQYFISRDFLVDPIFRKACKEDAATLCNAPRLHGGLGPPNVGEEDDVATSYQDSELDPMPFSMVMSCLYRHIYSELGDENIDGHLSVECEEEVHRIIKQRALDVNLNPDIERSCRVELGRFCSDQVSEKGSEFVCLQDNYEQINPDSDCRNEIEKLTRMEGRNVHDFDSILIRECESMLEKYCSDLLDSEDEGKVMECLINAKEVMESAACAAGVTHFQLIQMKDFTFNYDFLKACKGDVENHCVSKDIVTKADVVGCLSLKVRNDVLANLPSSVSSSCRKQLTVENLQLHKSIEFNPELKKSCTKDQEMFCLHVRSGKAQVIECLRENKHNLSPPCYRALFQFEEEEFNNPNLDFQLMRACRSDIKEHCRLDLENGDSQLALECLLQKKEHLLKSCRSVVTEREKEIFSNANLNVDLMNSCAGDIHKWCSEARQQANNALEEGIDPEGIVYKCLKKIFISKSPQKSLSVSCYNHIEFVVAEQEKNYVLDPQLRLHCIKSIQKLCTPAEGKNVVECLKNQYFINNLLDDSDCMVEVARLLVEGQSDIMADPVLHEACSTDLTKHCLRVPEGHGRLIACLNNVEKYFLTSKCLDELEKRKEMWKVAMKNNVQGIGELSQLVVTSEHSSYMVTMLTLFILSIMLLGAFCGRMSRRVARERKAI